MGDSPDPKIGYIYDSLISMYNPLKDPHGRRFITENIDEIFKKGEVLDSEGKSFGDDSMSSLTKMYKDLVAGKSVYVKGKPYALEHDFGLQPSVKSDRYSELFNNYSSEFELDENNPLEKSVIDSINAQKNNFNETRGRDIFSNLINQDIGTFLKNTKPYFDSLKAKKDLSTKEKSNLKALENISNLISTANRGVFNPTIDDLNYKEPTKEVDRSIVSNSDRYKAKNVNNAREFQRLLTGRKGAMYGGEPLIQVALISDCKRIFKYNPDTKKIEYPLYNSKVEKKYDNDLASHYENLDKINLDEVLNSGNYYYTYPGSNKIMQIVDGVPKDFDLNSITDSDILRAFESEVQLRTMGKNDQATEINERNEQLFRYDIKRNRAIFSELLGSKVGGTGSDEFRDFPEKINDALVKTGVDYNYPDVPKFSEEDIVALTTLSFADKEVEGNYYKGSTKEASTVSVFGMWPGDFFIEREGKTGNMLQNISGARLKTKEILTEYQKTGDDMVIAKHLANTLFVAGTAANAQTQFSNQSVGQLMPSAFIYNFIEGHQDILNKSRNLLKDNPKELEKFDVGLKRIVVEAKVFETAQKANAKDVSILEKTKYKTICSLIDKESYFMANSVGSFPNKEMTELNTKNKADTEKLMQEGRMDEFNELMESFSVDLNFAANNTSTYPLKKLYEDPRAEKFLADFIENEMENTEFDLNDIDYDFLQEKLSDIGLIPRRPVFHMKGSKDELRYDDSKKVENQKIADDYREKIDNMDAKKAIDSAKSNLEKSKKIDEKLRAISMSFLDDMGLNYDEVKDLSIANHIPVSEYVSRMYEDNQNAEWDILTNEEKVNGLEEQLKLRELAPSKVSCDKMLDRIIDISKNLLDDPNQMEKLGDIALHVGKMYKNNSFELKDAVKTKALSEIVKKGTTFKNEMAKKNSEKELNKSEIKKNDQSVLN